MLDYSSARPLVYLANVRIFSQLYREAPRGSTAGRDAAKSCGIKQSLIPAKKSDPSQLRPHADIMRHWDAATSTATRHQTGGGTWLKIPLRGISQMRRRLGRQYAPALPIDRSGHTLDRDGGKKILQNQPAFIG